MHPRNVPSALDARPTVRHPPHGAPTTAPPPPLLIPHLAPPPPPPAPLPFPCSSTTSLTERASAPPTTTPRRHLHMADDAVVAGAAVHCARPAPAPLLASRRHQQQQQQQVDDAGCGGSSDDHYQQDVIRLRRTRSGRAFPPPISVIGKGGRPWLSLRAHREGGRLVLREMRLPSQELPLQPCKEDGRFKLLIHPEARARPCGAGAAAGTAGTAREG
uniref:FAF domain-containing protein n=2 Tax=Sorghum bicolor TaxID=4558 RepID=C6JS56_SORBI